MKRRLRLGPTQSPVVSTALNRRYTEARAASVGRWGAACLAVGLFLLLDLWVSKSSVFEFPAFLQVSPPAELLQRSQGHSGLVHRSVGHPSHPLLVTPSPTQRCVCWWFWLRVGSMTACSSLECLSLNHN